MKELNLEVGSKKWSIQLGDCEVETIDNQHYYPIVCKNKKGREFAYGINGKITEADEHASLFESNPFEEKANLGGVREIYGLEPKFVFENKDGFIEQKENKAELINALCRIRESFTSGKILIDVETKLQKLLESI